MKRVDLETFQRVLLDRFFLLGSFLSERSIPWSPAYGTLLGLRRGGSLIPWDFDIDVFVPLNNLLESTEAIATWARSMGWVFLKQGFGLHRLVFPDLLVTRPSKKERPRYNAYIDIYPFVLIDASMPIRAIQKTVRRLHLLGTIKQDKDLPKNAIKRFVKPLVQKMIPTFKNKWSRLETELLLLEQNSKQHNRFVPLCPESIVEKRYLFSFDLINRRLEGQMVPSLLRYDDFLLEEYGQDYLVPKNDHRGDDAEFFLC